MKSHNLFRNSGYSGGFLPILDEPTKGFENCMGTIYYRNPAIRDTLNALQSRQRRNLKYSLVSAYVRRTDAAFAGDLALQTLLDDMRDLLLNSEARKAINMLDVPEDERHRGKDWRAQMLASGVPKVPSKFGVKGRLSAGDGKPEEPEPDVPPLRVGNPVPPAWEDGDRPIRKGLEDLVTLVGGGLALALLCGGWMASVGTEPLTLQPGQTTPRSPRRPRPVRSCPRSESQTRQRTRRPRSTRRYPACDKRRSSGFWRRA